MTTPKKRTSSKPPPPPRTKSGNMPAVKVFREAIDIFDEQTVPAMDVQIDRMNELLKKVTITPTTVIDPDSVPTPIPNPPRTPSMVDEEERAAIMQNAPTTIPEPPVTTPEVADPPDSGEEKR